MVQVITQWQHMNICAYREGSIDGYGDEVLEKVKLPESLSTAIRQLLGFLSNIFYNRRIYVLNKYKEV